EESIVRYRKAEAAAYAGGIEWQLAEWGLGVALDRDEQIERSTEAIRRALERDPTMARLGDEGVFFEPPGDRRYYEALGHEVAGDVAQALAGYRAFIAEAPASRYLARARAHLRALERSPAPRSGPRPQVAFGEPMPFRALRPPARLRAILVSHEEELRTCFARAVRSEPSLSSVSGELRLGLEIQ